MPNDKPDLFPLDVRGLEDRPPLLDLGLVVGRERLRILILARRNVLAEIAEPLAHASIGQGVDNGAIEFGMMSFGVPLGHQSACQIAMCSPGTPASSTVGMSGAAARRALSVTA